MHDADSMASAAGMQTGREALRDRTERQPAAEGLPLAGIRVVEFSHMVMGPACGMILADLGAEVIKIEPVAGDSTRRLIGSGAGFFPMFNRNKKSMAVDIKSDAGRELVLRLVAGADVFSENFKSGTVARLGFGYEALSSLNPGLVYVSHKRGGPDDGRSGLYDRARRHAAARRRQRQ
jgi:crotonobetainyl-CoA:carnitine CoA-transferase CaiB-like acyl-CoA transferase